MTKLEEALKIINELSRIPKESERVKLEMAHNRILAEDVFTDMDFPSFDKSAMDGYAISKEEIGQKLNIIEFIPAGKKPKKIVTSGTCSNIMTGAMVPEGADMVVMQEDVIIEGDFILIQNLNSKTNILKQGEDLQEGSLVLKKGIQISPIHIGLLASIGIAEPLVYKQPIVSIISTGNELVSPSEKPIPPKIRNSNSLQLFALSNESGALTHNLEQVEDSMEMIFNTVKKAMKLSDIVVLTGGASVGEYDFTSDVFDSLNAKTHFTRLAIQPGKPVLFATVDNKFLFGLSGNPVSSFVQFQLLVKPLLNKLIGKESKAKSFKLPISIDKKRKRAERLLFFPIRINEKMEAEPLDYHGSAHLNAYQEADGMASFPIGFNELKKGTIVDVRPI